MLSSGTGVVVHGVTVWLNVNNISDGRYVLIQRDTLNLQHFLPDTVLHKNVQPMLVPQTMIKLFSVAQNYLSVYCISAKFCTLFLLHLWPSIEN